MKVDWSKEVHFIPEWNENTTLPDNAQLKATFKLLDNGELQQVREEIKDAGFKEDENGKITVGEAQTPFIINSIKKYLPGHVTLTGNDNFKVEDVVAYPQFIPLAMELFFKLVNDSAPKANDVKN